MEIKGENKLEFQTQIMSTTSDFTPKQTEKLRLARWSYAKDMHTHALALRDTIQKMRKMQRAMKRTVVRVAGKVRTVNTNTS